MTALTWCHHGWEEMTRSSSSHTIAGLSLMWLFPMGLEKHGGETKVKRMKAGISSWAKCLFFSMPKFFSDPN